jgi:hypothetical protein
MRRHGVQHRPGTRDEGLARHGQHRHRPARLILVCLLVALALPAASRADEPSSPASRWRSSSARRGDRQQGHQSKGVTRPRRLTLSDGRITHDALFQVVDEEKSVQRFQGGRVEINWRDSWMFNVAAYRLAELVGLGDMVPVTVERTHDGQGRAHLVGDEREVRRAGARGSRARAARPLAWSHQVQTSRVFTELVYDTDRNMGNQLIDDQWRLWMVDFTRAFRRHDFLKAPNTLAQCSRSLRDRLRTLTRERSRRPSAST